MAKKITADKEPRKVGRPPKVKNGGVKKDDARLKKYRSMSEDDKKKK
jgi:hypothetical protein